MDAKDFRIGGSAIFGLVIVSAISSIGYAIAYILHWELPKALFVFLIALHLASWIIVFADMLSIKLYNKSFWIISMFAFPTLAPLLYLVQRKRFIRLGEKFDHYKSLKKN